MSENPMRLRMSIGPQVLIGLLSIGVYVFCDYTSARWAEQMQT